MNNTPSSKEHMVEGPQKAAAAATQSRNHLYVHYAIVSLLYCGALAISNKLLLLPEAHKDFITSLSSAAILATFGSAIATIAVLWTSDRSIRITLNVDILFKDILEKEAWRRWPFLPRAGKRTLLDGSKIDLSLANPVIPLNVGSHCIRTTIPTVQEDFFDLPLLANLWPLLRFRSAAHTSISNVQKDSIFPENDLTPMNQYMAYECMVDIWGSVLIFRLSRYVVHFGAALTISSAVLGGAAAWGSAALSGV